MSIRVVDESDQSKDSVDLHGEVSGKQNLTSFIKVKPNIINFSNIQPGQLMIDETNLKAYTKGPGGVYSWVIVKEQ